MFDFIKKKFKFNKIVKMQFNQQIIFLAQEGGNYMVSDAYKQLPAHTENFNVSYEFIKDETILRVVLNVDDETYCLDINIETESFLYFLNFLEAICCFETWRSLVYVSSTDNVNDFLYVKNIDDSKMRIIALLNVNGEQKTLDKCIDTKAFISEFVYPFIKDIGPFNEYLKEAQELAKYSPKKINLPL